MQISKETSIAIVDDNGCELKEGISFIYQTKDGVDMVAKYNGYEKGYILIENITDGVQRRLLPGSIKSMVAIYDVTNYELPFK